jgi:uncharacterized protein
MDTSLAAPASEAGLRRFIHMVYAWMCGGLLVTGGVAAYMASDERMIRNMMNVPFLFTGLILAEVALVFFLAIWVKDMAASTARFAFLFYAALTGVTLSVIFLAYTRSSIENAFFLTSAMYGALCVYGYTTDADLTEVGSLCFMALIGTILASVVNFWLHSPVLVWITTYINIAIFCGLTAYDAQRIKGIYRAGDDGTDAETKEAIMGALSLYLDFINLFLEIAQAMGKER